MPRIVEPWLSSCCIRPSLQPRWCKGRMHCPLSSRITPRGAAVQSFVQSPTMPAEVYPRFGHQPLEQLKLVMDEWGPLQAVSKQKNLSLCPPLTRSLRMLNIFRFSALHYITSSRQWTASHHSLPITEFNGLPRAILMPCLQPKNSRTV